MNIYRHVADYDRDYADPQLITVNGAPLEPGPEDEFATDCWSRLVLAMMCHEYGSDITRHEMHYALLCDDLLACLREGGEDYYWELTSDDLAAAVYRARCRLDADSDYYLSAAVRCLDLLKCRVLLNSGFKAGKKTYLRLLKWYKLDRLDHDKRRQRREILRLLDDEMYRCIRDNFETPGGETLLHAMCGSCTPLEDIKMLLDVGAHDVINHSDHAGNTPLHRYAARDFHHRRCPPTLKGFELLLEHGADIDVTNGCGQTAYQLVLGNNPQQYLARRRRLARFLEDNGAETNVQPGP